MKNLIHILFVSIIFLAACNSGEKNVESSEEAKPEAKINLEYLVSYEMDVSGMTCTGCENTIKSGVSELAGVESVEALHTDAKTYVVFDSTLTSIDEVASAIESKGYKVENYAMQIPKETEEISE
jgi:copper chaperone CopZ